MNKKFLLIFLLVCFSSSVFSIDYLETTGDSIFVAGVDWQKIDEVGGYNAYITIDLAYGQFANPLNRYEIVSQYNWSNWWADFFRFDDIGELVPQYDENGVLQEYVQLDFYTEPPYSENEPQLDRVGYWGLPFYIKYFKFECDITDSSKGGYSTIAKLDKQDVFSLTRYEYDGFPLPYTNVETSVVPLGWITYPGNAVRYNNIPVYCNNIGNVNNARLSFILQPNPIYRNVDPNTVNSETWSFQDLIPIFPDLNNNNDMSFNIDYEFDLSSATLNYTWSDDEIEAYYNNLFPKSDGLDCVVNNPNGVDIPTKYAELNSEQSANINTGNFVCIELGGILGGCSSKSGEVYCSFAKDPGVQNLQDTYANDVLTAISVQKQRDILTQFSGLDKKLSTKKFVSNSVIPFFGVVVILIFYIIQLLILGVAFLGIIPLMFSEFIKGIKDAFSVDDLIKPVNRGKKK